MHSTQYPPSRQTQSTYPVPLPHHRQTSSGSSGSYPSPSDTTSQHSPGPNYAYGHRSNASLGSAADVKREYDEPPAGNRYYASNGYGYSSGNSGYAGPPNSQPYYQQNSQGGGHYQPSGQFGSGSSSFSYSTVRQRCSDSPPVSPVTSTPDYFINPSSSSSASSPTSPASPANGYHPYGWQPTHPHQPDGYTPSDLPPQYNPHGSHNPFQPPPRSVSQISQALAASTTAPRPFVCEDCGMNFSRQHDLKRHQLSHNTPPVKKTHPCPYCGKHLSRRDAIKRHVVSKQCPVAAEKNYGWPVPENFVHATPIPPTTTRTRGGSTSEDARIRRESISNPYPRVEPLMREAERAEIERLERTGGSEVREARIVVDPRSGGGYPVAYTAGRS